MNRDYFGLRTRRLENEHLRLEFLLDAGPRIVRLVLAGSGDNQFAELPDVHWSTPFGEYWTRGGHRLWVAPERFPESSAPDNAPIQVEEWADGVRLVQLDNATTGIRKSIALHLDARQPAVTVQHELRNESTAAITLAPWAITALPPGGTAVLPLATRPIDRDSLAPNRNLVLWSYTRWGDARLETKTDRILVHAAPDASPLKIGYLNQGGWVGYLRGDTLFVKRFEPNTARHHPDLECNAEVYACDRFLELETLGPLETLKPGETASHRETWEWHRGDSARSILANLRLASLDS